MRVVKGTSFRCELCGKFRTVGVTEDPEVPLYSLEDEVDRSYVCAQCVIAAEGLLAKDLLGIDVVGSDLDDYLKNQEEGDG